MIEVILMIFVASGNGSFQIVADKEIQTIEECVNTAIKINAGKDVFNAACYIKQKTDNL